MSRSFICRAKYVIVDPKKKKRKFDSEDGHVFLRDVLLAVRDEYVASKRVSNDVVHGLCVPRPLK